MSKNQSSFKGRHGLGAVSSVADFRSQIDGHSHLTAEERETLVTQAEILIRDFYVHLPLKQAMHAINPTQRLQLLRCKLEELSDREFHAELLDIFKELRDLHTNYSLPAPYSGRIAFLGILIEYYEEAGEPRWMVSKVAQHLVTDEALVKGAVITHWNGMPMDLAVWRNAEKEAGSNPAARYARGLESMSLRFLGASLPPDEDWVDLVYHTDTGEHETRLAWMIFDGGSDLGTGAEDPRGLLKDLSTPLRHQVAVDWRTEVVRQTKKLLFSPAAVREEKRAARASHVPAMTATLKAANIIPTRRPDDLTARLVDTSSGTFGYLKLWTFHMKDDDIDAFLWEVIRLLEEKFPPEGLIIDVRGNGGGYVIAAEFLLQFLTPRRIEPEPSQFINTAATRMLTSQEGPMRQWGDSLVQGLRTGAQFSNGIPLSKPELVNSMGQIYHGPVVLITDAFCYSACDMFAAGFKDHEIGTILGTNKSTGAGGANVLTHQMLMKEWPNGPLRPLPGGAGMRVSLRRTLRVGRQAGQPVEDLGIEPDILVPPTRDDLLHGNRDLLERAGAELATGTPRLFKAHPLPPQPGHGPSLRIKALNIAEIDIYVDNRPFQTHAISDGVTHVPLPVPPGSQIDIKGFQHGALVGARRFRLIPPG